MTMHSKQNDCSLISISLFRIVQRKCGEKMQVLVCKNLLIVLLIIYEARLNAAHKIITDNQIKIATNEPRLYFQQILDATGWFPVEINVPDTISSMMSGISSMYDSVSSYFNSGNEGAEGSQNQPGVTQNEMNLVHLQPIKAKHLKKKVKKKSGENDDDENLFDYFGFLIV